MQISLRGENYELVFPKCMKSEHCQEAQRVDEEPVSIKHLPLPAGGLKHLSMQTVAEWSCSEMQIDGYRGFIRNRNPYKLHPGAISQRSL